MANITLDLSQFKASGIYTLEFDASQSVTIDTQTTRLVVGFSKSGPFNTPVFCQDVKTAKTIFGDIDRDLEKKGSFFHRSLFTCLEAGPCFALALMPLNDDTTSANPDTTTYKSFSLSVAEGNGLSVSQLVSAFYNKERFFKADEAYFGEIVNSSVSPNAGKILNFVNLGLTPFSIIVRKTGDINGFNITARDWFGAGNVPSFIKNEFDFISEYFITVDIISGNWTNYATLSNDPTFSSFFDGKGLIKSKISQFLTSPYITRIGSFQGSIIPDLRDSNDTNYSIDTIINNSIGTTGLFTYLDRESLADYDFSNPLSSGNVDMVGHSLLNSNTDNVDFLSYRFAVSSTFNYVNTGSTEIATTLDENGAPNTKTAFYLSTSASNIDPIPAGTYTPSANGYHQNDPSKVAYLKSFYGQGNNGKFNNLLVLNSSFLSQAQYDYFTSLIPGSSMIAKDGIVGGMSDDFALVSSLNVISQGNHSLINIGISHPSKNSEGTDINKQSKVQGLDTVNGIIRVYNTNSADINIGDWIYAQKGNTTFYFRVIANAYDSLYSAQSLTVDLDSNVDALNFSKLDSTYTIVWASEAGVSGSNFDVINANVNSNVNLASFIKPNTLVYDSTNNYYVAGEFNKLYKDFKAGVITDGDTVYKGLTQVYVDGEFTRNDFNANILILRGYIDESLSTSVGAWGFSTITDDNNVSTAGELLVYTSAGGYALELNATGLNSTKTSFYLNLADGANLNVGDYVVADPLGTNDPSNFVLTRILTKQKIVNGVNANKFYYTTNQRVVVTAGNIKRYKTIDNAAVNYQFTYLDGFKVGNYHLPNGGQDQLAKILSLLDPELSNIGVALSSRDMIAFRYIVDTFDGGLAPMSYPKNIISKLAKSRQKCLALINAPSIAKFKQSIDPRFTDAPTASTPMPLLNTNYIADGGNLQLGPSFTYSLPDEVNGSKFSGFFSPFLTITEYGKSISIPPAAAAYNNFVRKFTNGTPYAIAAGPRRGVLSNPLLTGLEYQFSDNDRANVEPFGLNPIIFKRGTGYMLYSDQTAYQNVSSAFNNLHVRDLLITIETAIEDILAGYMFEFNDASTRLQIKTIVDSYLENIRTAGGIYSFATQMDSNNNTNKVIDTNSAILDVTIEPARGINKFINRVTVTKTGGISSGGFASV